MKRSLINSPSEDYENKTKKCCYEWVRCDKSNSIGQNNNINTCKKRKFNHDNLQSDEPSTKKFKFIKVCGVKRNSKCIYVPKQKLMYIKNAKNKAGRKIFICYNYKKQKCTARMVEIAKGICQSTPQSKPHTCVGNHQQFMRNCLLLRDIKNNALKVNETCGTEAFKISTQAIIDQERLK